MPSQRQETALHAAHIQPIVPPSQRADTYPKGRRCTEPGCITILSIWNPGPAWCFLHTQRHESELAHDEGLVDLQAAA